MSERARAVLRAIDEALLVLDHHPRLFAKQARDERTHAQLARALERYKRPEPAARDDTYVGDREAGRVDRDWEDANADRRRERFAKRKPAMTADLRGRLRAMDVDTLRAWVLAETTAMSTVRAGNVEPSRGGSDSAEPPRQQALSDDPRWTRYEEIEKRGLLLKADLILEAKGHGVHATGDRSSREAARLIVDRGRGLSCKETARLPDLSEFPGITPAFVRRVREVQGTGLADLDVLGYPVSTIDGEAKMSAQDAGVRRVAIAAGAQ
jgi:hypothetical protein